MSATIDNFDTPDSPFCIDCGESHCDDPKYTADNEGPLCEGCFDAYEIVSEVKALPEVG